MEITEFAQCNRIPLRTLRALLKAGLIQNPLSPNDIVGLRFICKTWANRALMRAQLASLTVPGRKALAETATLKTKWERYAYSRYRNLDPGQKITIKRVIQEIQENYNFLLNHYQVREIYKIRDRVYHQRNKEKTALETSEIVTEYKKHSREIKEKT